MRRLRKSPAIRQALTNVTLSPTDLICPLFVDTSDQVTPVESMPGVSRFSVAACVEEIKRLHAKGLRWFILFGVTPDDYKDNLGQYASDPESPVMQVLTQAKAIFGSDIVMAADTCMCEYTDHGHCGVLCQDHYHQEHFPGPLNDQTLLRLGEIAVAQAKAGADIIAPSGMMDHMVHMIRTALDQANFQDRLIFSYSVKYASAMYGPFRDAGDGGMAFGDRKGYQMDITRDQEWRSEVLLDVAEGADMVMVKPAVGFGDIIRGVRDTVDVPVGAYHVSGEYAMLMAAAERGWIDLDAAGYETLINLKRSGADLIVTYLAERALEWC